MTIGLQASIRAINWPAEVVDPLQLPDFETRARRERYRQLGLGCASKGLRYLLLAHHGDDQVEGILGRIIAGYTGAGLEGMKRVAPIPECRGLWGVSEGPITASHPQNAEPVRSSFSPESVGAKNIAPNPDLHIAAAGISIHRPLLQFTKLALQKTCEQFDIHWKEDKTNQVLALTLRNTTRSLLQRQKLPLALRERSLMGLAARKSALGDSVHRASRDMLRRMHAMHFDPRAGRLTLELSHEDVAYFCRRLTRFSKGQCRSCTPETYNIVHRWATAVSPRSHIEQDVVKDLASAFVRALGGEGVDRFTGGGVWWCREPNQKLDQQPNVQVWSLTRQPLSRIEQQRPCLWANLPLENGRHSAAGAQHDRAQAFGTWQLLDDRFWLSVNDASMEPVLAKLLDSSGLTQLRDALAQHKRKLLDQQLRAMTPGESRFTLPALADNQGRVLALPTLGFVIPASKERLTWSWCYKHIDLG